jgi:hypothetical protein
VTASGESDRHLAFTLSILPRRVAVRLPYGVPVTHDHVALLADNPGGRQVRESTPARSVGVGEWLLLATPGLVQGCAAGDVVRVNDDGSFQVLHRGGNVSVNVYSDGSADMKQSFALLKGLMAPLEATVEAPDDLRFLVVTCPISAGFPAIEEAMGRWVSAGGGPEWCYGNVYDDLDRPLDWWEDGHA